MKYTTTHS